VWPYFNSQGRSHVWLNVAIWENVIPSNTVTMCVIVSTIWLMGDDEWLSWFIVLNDTFNNVLFISGRSALLVKETGVPRENHRPVASHWQTLSHNIVTLVVIGTDYTGSYISNYHTITITTAHGWWNIAVLKIFQTLTT
jgi:hypothetical protein